MSNSFEIKILRQHWIRDDGLYSENDLCSHGELFLKIGNEVLSDKASGSWCLSASALFLLRTLKINHVIDDLENFLVPCCGHFLLIDTSEEPHYLVVMGCPNGIDWNIQHKNNFVELSTEKGEKAVLEFSEYAKMVLDYVNEIENFYGDINQKVFDHEEDKETFQMFWKEWAELKGEICSML